MIVVLVVTSLALVNAESSSSLQSSNPRAQTNQQHHDQAASSGDQFLMANSGDTKSGIDLIRRMEGDFATRREYDDDNIDLGRFNDDGTRYRLMFSHTSGDGDSSAPFSLDGADPSRSAPPPPASSKNLARLLYGMPQFDRFYAKYPVVDKRAGELRRFISDRDDKEFGSGSNLAARIYREPLGKSTERLVQRLRDQLMQDPRTFR